MGATYVDVAIRNPADPLRSWTGKCLVDTGAVDSLVPRARLEAIGLRPRGRREYVPADGRPIALDIAIAEIEFEGEIVGGTIIYGDDDAEPLPGVTALVSGGFEVDPRSETLKRLPATSCTWSASTPAPSPHMTYNPAHGEAAASPEPQNPVNHVPLHRNGMAVPRGERVTCNESDHV